MMNMLNQILAQQGMQVPNQDFTKEEDLIIHQEPIALAMRTMMKILEYEKRLLPTNVFNPMVDSLKQNIIEALDGVKMPVIPPASEIVSINGEPASIQSQG